MLKAIRFFIHTYRAYRDIEHNKNTDNKHSYIYPHYYD
jgi:hypothetical protein